MNRLYQYPILATLVVVSLPLRPAFLKFVILLTLTTISLPFRPECLKFVVLLTLTTLALPLRLVNGFVQVCALSAESFEQLHQTASFAPSPKTVPRTTYYTPLDKREKHLAGRFSSNIAEWREVPAHNQKDRCDYLRTRRERAKQKLKRRPVRLLASHSRYDMDQVWRELKQKRHAWVQLCLAKYPRSAGLSADYVKRRATPSFLDYLGQNAMQSTTCPTHWWYPGCTLPLFWDRWTSPNQRPTTITWETIFAIAARDFPLLHADREMPLIVDSISDAEIERLLEETPPQIEQLNHSILFNPCLVPPEFEPSQLINGWVYPTRGFSRMLDIFLAKMLHLDETKFPRTGEPAALLVAKAKAVLEVLITWRGTRHCLVDEFEQRRATEYRYLKEHGRDVPKKLSEFRFQTFNGQALHDHHSAGHPQLSRRLAALEKNPPAYLK